MTVAGGGEGELEFGDDDFAGCGADYLAIEIGSVEDARGVDGALGWVGLKGCIER